MRIPLIKPCITGEDHQCMVHAVNDEAYSDGKNTRVFEQKISSFLSIKGAIATNSCTSSIILALSALGVKRHDEVVIPTYTCISILHAVSQFGAIPKLADIEINTNTMNYNVCANSIEKILSSKTKVIIVPHMFGVSAQLEQILAFNIPVIEDITLSFGAKYKNNPLGTWGSACVSSFHLSKLLPCGEGGMFGSTKLKILDRARYLNSWEQEQVGMRTGKIQLRQYETRYNYHLSGILASLGISQLKKMNKFTEQRRKIANIYTNELKHLEVLKLPNIEENTENIYQRYLVNIDEHFNIIEILNQFHEYGIEVGRGVYPPLHHVLGLNCRSFSNTEKAVKSVLSLPVYPSLNENDLNYIIDSCKKIFSRH